MSNSLLIASRLAWVGTDRRRAVRYAEEAAEVVEVLGGADLAMAYSVLSQLAMLGGFADETMAWADKALALVGDGDTQVRAHALNNIGTVKMMADPRTGLEELFESRRITAALGLLHDETRACVNLAWNYLMHYELDEAIHWIEEATKVVGEAEMPSFESYTHAERAWWHEMRGEWEEAESIATVLMERDSSLKTAQVASATLLARISTRRGSPQARSLLDDAVGRAEVSEEAQRLGPAYAVLVESAWLGEDLSTAEIDRAIEVMNWCNDHHHGAAAGEIGMWLTLMGYVEELPDGALQPHRLLSDGNWQDASAWWAEHGTPYERAVALSLGDSDAQLTALGVLDDLEATPLATRVRNRLQSAGVKGIPRGPQKTTRDSPLGLTARQTDVLELLVEDLTNAEIADRLFISTRTVDHHVSAILAKLGAATRSEAADKARHSLSNA